MLGQIQEWFYHDLAGIQSDPDSAGFKKIIINPQPVGDVTWVKASYNSIRGKIVSDWKRDGGKFTLKVSIPGEHDGDGFCSRPICRRSQSRRHDIPANGKWTARIFVIGSGDYTFVSSQ